TYYKVGGRELILRHSPLMKLTGKKALITGGSQGIGQGIAYRLAEEGADVVIDYVGHADLAQQTVKEIQKLGRQAIAIQANLDFVTEIQGLVQKSVEALGGIDILVNNAGVEKHADFWDVTEKDYDFVLDTNLKGAFFVTQAFVRHRMNVKQPGKI